MDRGAWQAAVHSVAQSWTRLKRLSTHAYSLVTLLLYIFSCSDYFSIGLWELFQLAPWCESISVYHLECFLFPSEQLHHPKLCSYLCSISTSTTLFSFYYVRSMRIVTIIILFISASPVPGRVPAAAAAAKSLQSCPTLCNPIDGSPPGSPIPGILQARILEWVAISFSNAWKWKAWLAIC